MATGEAQELVRTLAWSSGGGATVIPAGALYADLVVEAFGTTPKTAVARIDLTKSA
ncbi:hypothetical protein [Chenggangzhangella methanolivorans]|uniref:Uncharacterized protein n=2 Tax=Chenggangzhangella methanolivorans TaxID=1437009 RepID=A0A9E6R9J1_9HYPH|nr:hypothetical protein [Chenggangzhangella methanolivorans]QZN99804.1 hypothetical protein K6K41_24595 [Chenggangzhangella methanolivorans]